MDRSVWKRLVRAARREHIDLAMSQTPARSVQDADRAVYTWLLHAAAHRQAQALGLRIPPEEALCLDNAGSPSYVATPCEGTHAHALLSQTPDADWTDPAALGWLHQFYISERHEAIVGLHKAVAAAADIADATQLFTPAWIARFLAENAIARLPVEGIDACAAGWPYYAADARRGKDTRRPIPLESIRILDPCVGCGHMLLHAFDVLFALYRARGESAVSAAEKVLRHNLYGLDIDPRVVSIARFALRVKARAAAPDAGHLTPNIACVVSSAPLAAFRGDIATLPLPGEDISLLTQWTDAFADAPLLGSLIVPPGGDAAGLLARLEAACADNPARQALYAAAKGCLPALARQARWLRARYDVVLTNPPFLSKLTPQLKAFIQSRHGAYGADLFSAFIHRGFSLCSPDGFLAYVTPNVWLSLKRHRVLREEIVREKHIACLLEPPKGAFFADAAVDLCAFVLQNSPGDAPGQYFRLQAVPGDMDRQAQAAREAVRNPHSPCRFRASQRQFLRLPQSPIAYWATEAHMRAFDHPPLHTLASVQEGLKTADNARFIRKWYEVDRADIGAHPGAKWVPHTKGGPYRKWYGNLEDVLLYAGGGAALKAQPGASRTGEANYFRQNVTWGRITSGEPSFRYTPPGSIPNMAGLALYAQGDMLYYLLGLLNSQAAAALLRVINPTLNFPPGTLASLPVCTGASCREEVVRLVKESIALAKADWDEHERSWDFARHPMAAYQTPRLSEAYALWKAEAARRSDRLRQNEARLDAIFAALYDMPDARQADAPPHPLPTPRAASAGFLSFATGCLLGRYTLDGFCAPDAPFLACDSFSHSLSLFLRSVYGAEALDENLRFLAGALGRRGQAPADMLDQYFARHFYRDHVQRYKKRPVYWRFGSGQPGDFHAIVYMHRYDGDTLPRLYEAAQNAGCEGPWLDTLGALRAKPPAFVPDDGIVRNMRAFRPLLADA